MSNGKMTRRQALRSVTTGAALGLWSLEGKLLQAAKVPASLKILEPFHGAVLNHRHGKQTADEMTIRVAGEARSGDKVTVNGVACRRAGSRFDADVPLRSA